MQTERLSQLFARLSERGAGRAVTLRRLLPGVGARDHALVALLVAICSIHPVPMPGVSIALALVAVLAGTRMALGLSLWVPAALLDRPLPAAAAAKLLGWAAAGLRRAERLIRPRLSWAAAAPRPHGAAIAACGLMLMIPIPPPSNVPPAAALLLLSLGVLESDGIVLALGYVATGVSAAFFTAIACLGWSGLLALTSLSR